MMTKGVYIEVTQQELNSLLDHYRKKHALSGPENKDRLFDEFLAYLQRNMIKVKQSVVKKPCKATLVQWQIQKMSRLPERSLQAYIYGLLDPQIRISGTHENTVYHMRTSPLVSFHFDEDNQEGIIETANSIYALKGPEGDPVTDARDIDELVDLITYEQHWSQDHYHRD